MVFGNSRQMAVISGDGHFPSVLAKRSIHIPVRAILTISGFAFCLFLVDDLQVILELRSVPFLLVSLPMAYANHVSRAKTGSSVVLTTAALVGLSIGTALILSYEATTEIEQLFFIVSIYILLTMGSWLFSKSRKFLRPQ